MARKEANPTIDQNKPVKGTKTELVIQEIQVRNAVRTNLDIQTWRDAHISAESVYYPNRTRLYDLYYDILLDGHLTGIVGKRKDAVLNKGLFFEGPDGKKVDAFDDLIKKKEFRKVLELILETQLWGISGIEFIPGKDFRLQEIPRKHIKPKTQVIAIEQNSLTGIDYTDLANVYIIGESDDLGILLKCAPYAIYKRGNMADWSNFIEIFGQPVRIIYYDAHDKQQKIQLKQTLDDSGNALALMLPKGTEFDMKDGKQSNGDGQLQERFKDSLNQEMSVIVLGNTETTTNGKTGSQAKSKTHKEEQLEITKSDLTYVLNYLNTDHFLNILRSYGYPVPKGGSFVFKKELDLDFMERKSAVDLDIVQTVELPVDDDYWYENYGITKPDNYDDLKAKLEAKKQQAPPQPPPPRGKKQRIDPNDPEQQDDQDVEDLANDPRIARLVRMRKVRNLARLIGLDFF